MRGILAALLALLIFFQLPVAYAVEQIIVPITFENGVPVVQLTIAGNNLPFMIDTGASDNLYLNEEALRLIPKVRKTGRTVKTMGITGKLVHDAELEVRDLTIDGMSFGTVHARTMTPWGLGTDRPEGPPPHSIIGLKLFNNKRILFNFPEKQLVIWDNQAKQPDLTGWEYVPFKRTSEGIIVPLHGSGRTYHVVLDAPSTISLFNTRKLQSEMTSKCDVELTPGEACKAIRVGVKGADEFDLILMKFPKNFESDGLIGREFFDKYAVYFDPAAGNIRIRKHAR